VKYILNILNLYQNIVKFITKISNEAIKILKAQSKEKEEKEGES